MTNNIYAFLLSSIAGISTLIGFLFIFIKKDREEIISKALGFASGVMITISIMDLIPSSLDLILKQYKFIYALFFILIAFFAGILLSSIVDKKIDKSSKNSSKLYKLGIITMVIIIMHNIPEDCSCYVSQ